MREVVYNIVMNEKVREKLKTLPTNSGVYVMHGADGDVIYVGKAKNLKNRVSQYFRHTENQQKCRRWWIMWTILNISSR